ncbi:MAG: glycosyltransferase [Thermoguttaceae bacterium]
MPVHNGELTLGRALASLAGQAFCEWELVAVDDCSTDSSHTILLDWAKRDPRIRVLRTATNQGPGAARNVALREARGEFVAYLDCDDEFYHDYLENVARLHSKADVLIFQYDCECDDPNGGRVLQTWDPAPFRDRMFMFTLSVPLGVAHRRELLTKVGGFDEGPWIQEEWDVWKRFARIGAEFLFVHSRSGIYHSVATSLTHSPRMSDAQRVAFERNRREHDCLFPGGGGAHGKRKVENLVFASPYSIIDPSSGAANATDAALQLLARCGFRCQAFGAARLDSAEEVCIEQMLNELGLPYEFRTVSAEPEKARVLLTRKENVPITLFRNRFTQSGPLASEIESFGTAFELFLHKNQPDAVLTYGGGPLGSAMVRLARRRDIPVVFALHNFAYSDVSAFLDVDYAIVPSQFSKDYYWGKLGLHCQVLPNVIDPLRVVAADRKPQYLTVVNPHPVKGLFVFARIAEQIARRRPDIPILVVDGRGRGKAIEVTGVDLSWGTNFFNMANTTDPRKFYCVTKVLVMPSLLNESFGLVAAEAMANGIPVLASNRGALPEIVGDGGILFEIPPRYTPDTWDLPSAEEVEPWVETILRLWDDEAFYRGQSNKALERARQWHPDRLRRLYLEFFRNVHPQPGSPVVLKPNPSLADKHPAIADIAAMSGNSAGAHSERPASSDRLEFIQVEPTTRCNFKCRFCAGRHLPQRDMTLETFEHVLRSSTAISHIRLQGEGEPLVHAGFFEMAEMARAKHPAVRVSTITNGILLSANADRLVELGLQHVFVSIDSANPQLFHELRGGDLDRVVEGIRALLAARASRTAARPAIGFSVTVLRQTVGELPGIVGLYERLALDGGISVQPLQEMPAYTRYYDEQMSKQLLAAADIADMNGLIMQDSRALAVLQRPPRLASFFVEFFAGVTSGSPTCPWLEKGLYVAADGTAFACCFQKDTDRDGFGVFGHTSTEEILVRRGKSAEQLWRGTPPAGCEQCSIAANIVGRAGRR